MVHIRSIDEELFDKPKRIVAEKGRRCAFEKLLAKEVIDRAVLIKYFRDPQQNIEQRHRSRLLRACNDNLECNVVYSMNKKNRWKVTAASILQGMDTSDVDAAVVEKVCTSKDAAWFGSNPNQERVNSLCFLGKDGGLTIKTAKGMGFKVVDVLRTDNKKKCRRNTKNARESGEGAERESNEKEGERAWIEYRISRTHPNTRVLMGKVCGSYRYYIKPLSRNKKVDITKCELEPDRESPSFEVDESEQYHQPFRRFRLCLGDFIAKSILPVESSERSCVPEQPVALVDGVTRKTREPVDGTGNADEQLDKCHKFDSRIDFMAENLTVYEELFDKPKGSHTFKGPRYGYEEKFARLERDRAILTKHIENGREWIGKRRRVRLLSACKDYLECNVMYSMNKKNRWQVDAVKFLKEADASEVDVAVAEKVFTNQDRGRYNPNQDRVNSFHLLDKEGNITFKYAGGFGAKISTLLTSENTKKRNASRTHCAKEAESKRKEEEEEEGGERARIEYRIHKAHHNPRLLMGSGRSPDIFYRKGRRRNKNVDMSELEMESDTESSTHIEEDELYQPNRDFSISLGDFITATAGSKNRLERRKGYRKHDESTKEETEASVKGVHLVDFRAVMKAPTVFEHIILDTTQWKDYNFKDQVDVLSSSSPFYVVRWLDANHQRASVDVTPKTGGPDDGTVKAIVVLEKCRKNAFRLLFNCGIAPTGLFSADTLKNYILGNCEVTSITKAVEVLAELAEKWEMREVRSGVPVSKDPFSNDAPLFYEPSVNCTAIATTAEAISSVKMADLLRQHATVSDSEPFERISHDDIEDHILPSSSDKKCISCKTCSMEDLFELDDCWQCRNCLRQHIVNLIRTKNIPLEIPLVTDRNTSTYDQLPALIPLPLVNFYTKMAATQLLPFHDPDIVDLKECPGCKQTANIPKRNEFHSCRCSSCGILWCSDCLAEPHWPVPCQEYKDWMEKWMQQYPFERLSNETVNIIYRVKCTCGGIVEMGDICEELFRACSVCGNKVNTRSHKMKILRKVRNSPFCFEKEYRDYTPEMEKLRRRHQKQPIKQAIAKPCAEARQLRFNKSRSTEIAKQCRRIKGIPAVTNLPLLRTTVLYLVEMGLAWLYMTKSSAQGMKSQLVQLLKMLEEVELELEQNRPTLSARILSLEFSLEKAKDLLKKTLNGNQYV